MVRKTGSPLLVKITITVTLGSRVWSPLGTRFGYFIFKE